MTSAPSEAPASGRSKRSIFVTEEAARFARKKLDARGTPDAVVRLGIRGGGCSGFSYVIQFEDEAPRERDNVFEFGDVKFVIDKKSLIYLAGATLDYEKTLMFQGLKFKNPNEASSCGCGHSFTVK
ncbi:MAG TPA: iron-sulfur cluster assembly accessory protein [Polyangiaceae bacterium]|nr:iron-sulfur cluster assembly accessory protein [Polyangiaceae bacterium]